MSGKSKIEWTELVWNPIVGCTKCSPGCENCYAERMACRQVEMGYARHIKNPDSNEDAWIAYSGVIDNITGKWNGNIICDESLLDKPLHWKNPRKIFVCSMADLFHPKVPFEFIQSALGIMALCPQHQFQLLTKRPEKMAELSGAYPDNAWLGVSISTQAELGKAKTLSEIPAAVKYLSLEPLLERIVVPKNLLRQLDQIIIGCESKGGGLGRKCKLEWIRDLIEQCEAANVPFFIKQIPISNNIKDCRNPKKWPEEYRVQDYPKGAS